MEQVELRFSNIFNFLLYNKYKLEQYLYLCNQKIMFFSH